LTDSPGDTHRYGAAFWIAVIVGCGLIAVGITTIVDRGTSTILNVGAVLVASDVAHDLVLLPLVALIALALRGLDVTWRAPLDAALGWTLVVAIVSVPLVGAFGRTSNNPSVLPLDYLTAVPTALGAGWAVCAGWLAIRLLRARRADGGAMSREA
jgi:hypothetical protein